MRKTLSDLEAGDHARILHIEGKEMLSQRLIELGLRPGVAVEITQKTPSRLVCCFERATLALRTREASIAVVEVL